MYSIDLRSPRRVTEGLALFVYFLIQTSCGQDPAFSETKFGSGQSYSGESGAGTYGQADVLPEDSSPGSDETSDSPKNPAPDKSPNLPGDSNQIIEACHIYERQTTQMVLNFPQRRDCSWNQNGNGAKKNEYMQARESQSRNFNLPDSAVLCGLHLESTMNDMHYDDFLFLTMNDYVLLGSNKYFVDQLEMEGNLFIWNWDRIFGKRWQETGTYCLAGSAQCDIPGHDISGGVNVSLNEELLSELALKIMRQETVQFSLTATGDNDDEDCFHSELNLEMSAEYIVIPD